MGPGTKARLAFGLGLIALGLFVPESFAATSTTAPARSPEWAPIGLPGYAASAGLFLVAGAATWLVPHPPGAWKRSIFPDQGLSNLIRFDDPGTRDDLSAVSDVLANLATIYPVVDAGLGGGLLAQDPERLLEMLSLDLEGAAVATSLLVLSKRLVARVRPGIPACEDGGYRCRSDASRRSFVSGHATAAFTGAGLTCLHHLIWPWSDDGLADALSCGTIVGLALSASLLRVAADQHYATDILGGAAVGLFSGLVVPYLLHFRGKDAGLGLPPGQLQLLLGAGLLSDETSVGPVGTAELGLVLGHDFGPFALQAGLDGRLLRRDDGLAVLEALPRLSLGLGGLSFGILGDLRHQEGGAAGEDRFSGGLWLGAQDEWASLALGWLPAFDGRLDLGLARLELSPAAWWFLRAEASRSPGPGDSTVATLGLSLGGRLSW